MGLGKVLVLFARTSRPLTVLLGRVAGDTRPATTPPATLFRLQPSSPGSCHLYSVARDARTRHTPVRWTICVLEPIRVDLQRETANKIRGRGTDDQ